MGVCGVVAGLAQAAILLVIVRAAAAVTVGTESFDASVGPFSAGELSTSELLWIGFGLIVLYFATELTAGWSIARMGSRTSRGLRNVILTRYAEAEWPAKTRTEGSSLVQLATANSNQAVNALVLAAQLLKYTGIFITLVASSFVISPLGAVFMIVAMGGLFLLTLPLVRATRRQSRFATQLNKAFAREVQEVTLVGREIQVFGVTVESLEAAHGLNERQSRLQFRSRLVNQISGTVFRVAALFLILASLAVLNAIGAGNAASMAAALLILLRSVSAGQAVQGNLQNFSEAVPWVDQIRANIAQLAEHTTDRDGREPVTERTGARPVAVVLEHVEFCYQPEQPVLRDVDIEIRPGECIGVIGRSGAGKTTLGELLLGLWEPTGGAILVDGEDLSRLARQDWAMRVAYVPQDPVLVSGTIGHNIRFFRSWVDRPAIERAASDALLIRGGAAAEFGLDVEITGGRGVSGGQRQRVAIARALAGSPGLIVLDEPTSALDVQSEGIIADTLEQLQGSTTMVIIAHRLSTLQHCDRILVLDRGKVVAYDEPDRLGDLHRYLDSPDGG